MSREESIIQGRDDDDDNNQEHSNEHSLVFLFGDLNDNSTSSSYNILTGNRYITNSSTEENTFIDLRREFGSDLTTPTYESFTIGSETERKDPKLIDHIMLADNNALIDKEWKVNDVLVVDNDFKYNDTTYMFSDHRMMMAVLSHDEFGGIRRGCTSIKGGLD